MLKRLFIVLILASLSGCDNDSITNHKTEHKEKEIALVASEKNIPMNFDSKAMRREEVPFFSYLIKKAENQAQYEELWRMFRFEKEMPKENFKESTLFFIGLRESGSCPYKMEKASVQPKYDTLRFYLESPEGICTTDATPRTFVIEVPRKQAESLKTIMIVEGKTETPISIVGNV
ncbi:hypothetical protein [Bacillus sp. 1P06AnD]|uniref:hypothetical protein n=1 Tax=Bacillus sp. 1P06AnD TaxID=3132208 RepID=UPI0039A11F98